MSKKRKIKSAKAPASKGSAGKAKSRPRWPWAVGGALLLAGLAYYFAGGPQKAGRVSLSEDSGAEETLQASKPLLELLAPSATGVDFQNEIREDQEHNIITNINQYNGGGVATGDFNNDGLPDIYFVSTSGKNRLYLNKGNFKFEDVTDQAGVGSAEGFETAVTAVDINADGWLDLYVCRAGQVEQGRAARLFVNNGAVGGNGVPTFTEKAAEYGLDDRSPCSGANFFDYDLDGDLDCYVINHPTNLNHANRLTLKYGPDGKTYVPDLEPKEKYDSDNFYRNDGGKFTNISKQAGIQNFGFGLSVSVTDINHDGWPDVYVGNDFVQPDNFFINNQKGGFTDQMSRYMRHNSMSSMGTELVDFDNDTRVDLLTVDMFPTNNYRQKLLKNTNPLSRYLTMIRYGYHPMVNRNVLQRNNGNGTFSDLACLAGIYKTDWSWSSLFVDFDNDGLKDLHIANGYRREVTNRDYSDFLLPEIQKVLQSKDKDVMAYLKELAAFKVRNFVYRNRGDWTFEDKSGQWMTMPGSWSNGAAWADFDGDGDLDLVVNNLDHLAFVYKNLSREQGGGNYLQAKLKGAPQNPFAVGASVLIEYANGEKQYQELNPNHGIFSSVEHLIHFGLGKAEQVSRLSVRWPDGKLQTLQNVPANQRLQLKWEDASGYIAHLAPPSAAPQRLFSEVPPNSVGINFTHKENPFVDFETWVLNPWTLTDLGPLMATADLNGDGLDDFYIGNAFDSPAALYLQTPSGTFRQSSAAVWEADKPYEDHGATFLDFDGDGDLDLFVLSGGPDANADIAWRCRLFRNDGKGNFTKTEGVLPNGFKEIGLRAAVHDYDGDGDPDLFIGGRMTPKKWPLIPRGTVLQNNNGKFTDVTTQVAGDFERCGMVTDLTWADLDGDGQKELVAVGEWMPVSVFKLQNGKLTDVSKSFGFDKSNGLWNRLSLADLDGDGDLDLVTGNLGLNTRFTARPDAPFQCYAKDFDNNGTLDPVVAFSENGKMYPLMQKEVLVKQMPSLKKKFLYSKQYAKATIGDIFSKKDLEEALTLSAYGLETCWWENQGGKFARRSLPMQAQASPANGILCTDFNGDGHTDILLAGNKYGFEVETNPCNAGNGALLLGDGKGNFRWLDNNLSGFWAMREARDLALLRGPGGTRWVLVANNNAGVNLANVVNAKK